MRSGRPLFVALEGIDGAGKSTHIQMLGQEAVNWGLIVGTYRYTAKRDDLVGRTIKILYTSPERSRLPQRACRSRLLQEVLFAQQAKRNLRDLGLLHHLDLVLCDRSAVTAFVYHHRLLWSNRADHLLLLLLEWQFIPDHVLLLTIRPDTASSRIASRSRQRSPDENKGRLETMAKRYADLVSGEDAPWALRNVHWHPIDAESPLDMVHSHLVGELHSIVSATGLITP